MTNTKILTIAIPTFNGASVLETNISHLVQVIKKYNLRDEVNIIVSINASTDNSFEICKQYSNFDSFGFYMQDENVGYDANVNSVVVNSITPYVWLLSDDELITEKGLLGVLALLKSNTPSYIFVNHNNTNLKKNISSGYKLYDDKKMFIDEMRFSCGLISSNIISKFYWMEWEIEKYIGTRWIHMGYIIELLNNSPRNYVLVFDVDYIDRTILNSGRVWGANGTFLNVGLSLVDMIVHNLDKNNKTGLYWGRKIIAGGYPYDILWARYSGLKLTSEIKAKIRNASMYNLPKYYFFILPVVTIPDFLLKFFVSVYCVIKNLYKNVVQMFQKKEQ